MASADPPMVRALRDAITASGQSLNQLSISSGIDRGRLSRFVRGERDLTFEAAARVCEVLGLVLHLPSASKADEAGPTGLATKKSKK